MPSRVQVKHPFRPHKTLASAFVVRQIFYPGERFQSCAVEWLSASGSWRSDALPTRGEYLIRPGGSVAMRRVYVVLELMPPYLAVVTSPLAP